MRASVNFLFYDYFIYIYIYRCVQSCYKKKENVKCERGSHQVRNAILDFLIYQKYHRGFLWLGRVELIILKSCKSPLNAETCIKFALHC